MAPSRRDAPLETRAEILRALAQAERQRARAIHALAKLPLRESPSGFAFSPSLQRTLRERAPTLQRAHGYRGHGVGQKYTLGAAQPDRGVTVFVSRKLSRKALSRAGGGSVPRWLSTPNGERVATDVVELKVTRRDKIVPGAGIGPEDHDNPGTLTCFAFDAQQVLVGITAGHVAAVSGRYVTPTGTHAVFGTLLGSSLSPVDGATIGVTATWSQVMPNGSHMIGARQLTDLDVNHAVSVYGGQSGGWSAGTILYLAPWISGWNLADAIVYRAPSLPGDSGGPVVDENGYLVGIHLGRGKYQNQDVAIAGSIARLAHDFALTPTF